jgi:hypothetical protein
MDKRAAVTGFDVFERLMVTSWIAKRSMPSRTDYWWKVGFSFQTIFDTSRF